MKLAILFITLATTCNAMTEKQANTIANILFYIEGGYKTKYLYGIRSISIKGETLVEREIYARRICLTTILKNYERWSKAGKKEDYLEFLQQRYCPISDRADTKGLNKNWSRNLRSKLPKDFQIK